MPDRVNRSRHLDLEGVVDRVVDSGGGGSSAILFVTTTLKTYPTVAGSFYAANPLEMDGPETEGAAATFTPDTSRTFYVLNLGTAVPPSGTRAVGHAVGGRWCFRWDG